MRKNLILNTDSYKLSHYLGYPQGTEYVYSYAESRGGKYAGNIFFGLQGFINEYLVDPITRPDIIEAREFAKLHGLPFNEAGWTHILEKHDGFLPLKISAVPEGTFVPTRNVLCTVENTDPAVPWLTSYIETALLRVWYPTTVATRIFGMKQRIKPHFDRTSDSGNMDFALLDFSSRGCSSLESNEIGGAAYLSCFLGSDSIPAVRWVNQHYHSSMSGFSVPATEHSIMCSWGEKKEQASFKHLIRHMARRDGILSVVSDSWDIFRACDYWTSLKDEVIRKNITLVVRPDSGEIVDVLPEVLRKLSEGFGTTVNEKGFHVLNHVKVLWGDGINEDSVTLPFEIAEALHISADSVLTGSGGGLMQANIDRDTSKFAFKASEVQINGKSIPIAKNPITDPGKMSKKGRLMLVEDPDMGFKTVPYDSESDLNCLENIYENGFVYRSESIDGIRARINSYL